MDTEMMKHTVLPGHVKMPKLGIGTLGLTGDAARDIVDAAIKLGYRTIDTAVSYRNEKQIGDVLKSNVESGFLKREDVFVTTKLPGIYLGSKEKLREGLEKSLARLQLEYVDLCLIHHPGAYQYVDDDTFFPKDKEGKPMYTRANFEDVWQGMEALVDAGMTRCIGVSNFNIEQLERILKVARIPIANQQIECHVYLQEKEMREFCTARGISITAFGTLANPGKHKGRELPMVMEDPLVQELSLKYNKTPAQIVLRFSLEDNINVIPKTSSTERLKENLDVYSFHLQKEDVEKLRKLDRDGALRYYDFLNIFGGHPDYSFKLPGK